MLYSCSNETCVRLHALIYLSSTCTYMSQSITTSPFISSSSQAVENIIFLFLLHALLCVLLLILAYSLVLCVSGFSRSPFSHLKVFLSSSYHLCLFTPKNHAYFYLKFPLCVSCTKDHGAMFYNPHSAMIQNPHCIFWVQCNKHLYDLHQNCCIQGVCVCVAAAIIVCVPITLSVVMCQRLGTTFW